MQPQSESHCDELASQGSADELTLGTSHTADADEAHALEAEPINGQPMVVEPMLAPTIDSFLQSVERKAFVMARYALKNEDDALDTVQDAMLKLCERYGDRSHEEWAPLFYRILQNGITDRHRPRGMQRLKRWIHRSGDSSSDSLQNEPERDTMDSLPTEQMGPQDALCSSQSTSRINSVLTELPARQREVFLLRNWQGLSVRETAEAMNISDGSVKTHLSRAVAALKERLQEQDQ